MVSYTLIIYLFVMIHDSTATLLETEAKLHAGTTKSPPSPLLNHNSNFVSEVFNAVARTSKVHSEALNVKSIKTAGIAFLSMITSTIIFNVLESFIADGSIDSANNQLIFDVRHGYSASDVSLTLANWGHNGRLLYLLIEAVDLIFYITAYRTLFVIAFNYLLQWAVQMIGLPSSIRWLAVFPVFLTIVDRLEDIGQIALTLLYDLTNAKFAAKYANEWAALARLSSHINQTKWIMVLAGSVSMVTIASLTVLMAVMKFLVTTTREEKTL